MVHLIKLQNTSDRAHIKLPFEQTATVVEWLAVLTSGSNPSYDKLLNLRLCFATYKWEGHSLTSPIRIFVKVKDDDALKVPSLVAGKEGELNTF